MGSLEKDSTSEALWTEILPGLYLGGSNPELQPSDERGSSDAKTRDKPTKADFDTVVTLYAEASPADWWVKELRFAFFDGDMSDFNPSELTELVKIAHTDWKAGKRVLVRCQAGLNRSGFVMTLLLMLEGMEAIEAIDLMRRMRSESVLCNNSFADWLLDLSRRQFSELFN